MRLYLSVNSGNATLSGSSYTYTIRNDDYSNYGCGGSDGEVGGFSGGADGVREDEVGGSC